MSTISRLIIEQQYASLGINTVRAQMKITTPRPQMQIEQIKPEMTVEQKRPEFKVNWKQVRSESGLKPPGDLALSIRDTASNKVYNYIGEAVQDGNHLAKVEQPGNRVAQISRQKVMKNNHKEVNLGSMPQSLPEVEWDTGYIKVKWSKHNFHVEWDGEYMPEIILDPPYSVEIYLREKPYIKIIVEDGDMPDGDGMIVDKKL